MKKLISLMLAVILAFSAFAAVTCSAAGEYQTYYVTIEKRDAEVDVVPCEGYSQYVLPGEDFKFLVVPGEGYTDTFVIVQVDGVEISPDVHGVYTISGIQKDVTVKAFLAVEDGQSNLFASLIVLIRNILAWFKEIINSIIVGTAT